MFHSDQRKNSLSRAILGLWRNWVIAVGLIAIWVIVSPLILQVWLAPLCISLLLLLQWIRSTNDSCNVPICSRLYKEASVIIFVTACVALAVYLTVEGDILSIGLRRLSNVNEPLPGILISGPVTAIVVAFFLLQKREPLVCQLCTFRHGSAVKNGLIGGLYQREWRYQSRLLLLLSLFVSIVDWAYFMFQYINVNLNRADYFFFIWLPLSIYLLSVVYLGWRYYSLRVYYCRADEGGAVEQPSTSTIRFIVICDDKILLDKRQVDNCMNRNEKTDCYDTPAYVTLPYQEQCDEKRAEELFGRFAGVNSCEIRRAYDSQDRVTYHNVFHFFAFIDERCLSSEFKLRGEWMTLGELRSIISKRMLSPEFKGEMTRIYRIAMAWKTYDRDGRRLYQIKHYRPTFRIKDIAEWDVDYNDSHWLTVGRFNEDCRFFAIRRFINRVRDRF